MTTSSEKLIPLLEIYLPKSRVAHSIRVAETARQLAVSWNSITPIPETKTFFSAPPSPEEAHTAGLLHDIAKALSPAKLCELGLTKTLWYNTLYDRYPAVWHAFAGPRMVQNLLGLQNHHILNAIRYHTTGAVRMTPLAKILYIADYIEPGRPFKDKEALQELLNQASKSKVQDCPFALVTAIIVTGSIYALRRREKVIHPLTLRCYNALSSALTSAGGQQLQAHVDRYYHFKF